MLRNFTPHTVHLYTPHGTLTLPSEGIARVSEHRIAVGTEAHLPLETVSYGDVTGLPEPVEGVTLIVSALVRVAAPQRHDLASPGEVIRDGEGRPIGCSSLFVNRAPATSALDRAVEAGVAGLREAARRAAELSGQARALSTEAQDGCDAGNADSLALDADNARHAAAEADATVRRMLAGLRVATYGEGESAGLGGATGGSVGA